jgi:hypothetical protein
VIFQIGSYISIFLGSADPSKTFFWFNSILLKYLLKAFKENSPKLISTRTVNTMTKRKGVV